MIKNITVSIGYSFMSWCFAVFFLNENMQSVQFIFLFCHSGVAVALPFRRLV